MVLLAYKRYVHKKGKRHGPYYYKNVRDESGNVKSIYLGKVTARGKKPLEVAIVFLTILLIIISALFFIQNRGLVLSRVAAEEYQVPFEVDQILIKVLVREDEYIGKELRVMNVDEEEQIISVEVAGVSDIVDVLDKEFTIKPGQTKIVRLNFSSSDNTAGIEQAPGVYIGKILAKSDSYQKEVPIVVEIESKNVLFDMNLNPVARDRSVTQGSSTTFEIRVFNLQSIDSFNVDMDFLVKDVNGNTIISERESVVVKTQASFFKTLKIPDKLKTGDYVFIAQASLGNSIGTASYLFEIEGPIKEGGGSRFIGFCRNDPLCWALSLIVLLLMFAIGAYAYFFIGAIIYQKLFGISLSRRSSEETKVKEKVPRENIGEIITPIVNSFTNFNRRFRRARESRIERRLEIKKQKIELKVKEEQLKNRLKEEEAEQRQIKIEEKEKKDRKKLEITERKGLVGKCRRLMDHGYKALDRNNVKKADRIYVKLMDRYVNLPSERKVEIFKEINSYYKSLLLKKQQLKRKQKQEEKDRGKSLKEKEAAKRQQEEKRLVEKERNQKLREEERKSRRKKIFGFFHNVGLVKTEKEKELREGEERQRQLEIKKREEDEKRERIEEEKQRELEKEEERKLREAATRKIEAEKRRKETQKESRLNEIKELEQGISEKDAKISKQKEKIKDAHSEIDPIAKDISKIEKDIEGVKNEKKILFKMYNESIGSRKQLSEERKSKLAEWKGKHDAKLKEKNQIKAKVKEEYHSSLKELENELQGLSKKERKEQEKWKKLELKAKYKLEEQERGKTINDDLKNILTEKKGIEEEFKGKRDSLGKGIAGGDILQKQKELNDHIKEYEKDIDDLNKEIESKERALERYENNIENLEEEKDKDKTALLDKKKGVGGLNYVAYLLDAVKPKRTVKKQVAKEPVQKKAEIVEEEKDIPEKELEEQEAEEKEAEKELEKSLKDLGKISKKIKEEDTKKLSIMDRLFKGREVKQVKAKPKHIQKEKAHIEVKRKLEDKSRLFAKCHNLLLKANDVLGHKDVPAAKKLYLKTRELYIKLEYDEKMEIYNELTALYNKLKK
mgnify:CR=1 FL=1